MGRLILHVDREASCAAVEPRGHPAWSVVWRWSGDDTAAGDTQ